MIRSAITAAALVTATLMAISSSAIGSAPATANVATDIEVAQIADHYAFGGDNYTILSGVTVKPKTDAGCDVDVTHIITVPAIDEAAASKKGDRLASLGCTVIALR